MKPPIGIKSFCMVLITLLVYCHTILATTDPKKSENTQKEQKEEQVEQTTPDDGTAPEAVPREKELKKEEEEVSISNVSFNFFFYLIYKIKYADLFKLPTRNSEDARNSLGNLDVERLFRFLSRPGI